MKIETGHSVTKDIAPVPGDRVRFVAPDGRTMFDVRVAKDGASIEVRGVDTCKIGDVIYDSSLTVEPKASNVVVIRPLVYSKGTP